MPRTGSPRLAPAEMMSRRDPRLTPPLASAVGAIVALAAQRARSAGEFAALRDAVSAALDNAAPGVAEAEPTRVHVLDLEEMPRDTGLAAMLGRLARR
ncbi:hypothetical protein [Falsiroseomonas sp. HW251]|uniref:hypothetical protein n=1 Tax=Falsiroseomonas sp. HW251 TaxID=3390998 RepID=UPI003D315F0D